MAIAGACEPGKNIFGTQAHTLPRETAHCDTCLRTCERKHSHRQVGAETEVSRTQCRCSHATVFGGGLVVQPNKIDWNFVFSNAEFYKNPTLYIAEIVTLVVFVLAAIWARHQDRKDVFKVTL